MRTAFRLWAIIGALVLVAGLGACSAIKLGYNNLEDVAFWWLDGYVDFTDEQGPRAREDLARLKAWHRAEELPRIADILGRMEQAAPGPISAEQACAFVDELRPRVMAIARQAEPALVTTAMGLRAEQLNHLQRKYAENNRKWRSEWVALEPAERRQKRFEQAQKRFETIYGSLDAPQQAVLRAAIAQSVFDPQRILQERQRRQQDLLHTLRGLRQPGVGFAEARKAVHGYLERVMASPDADYRAYQQALLQEGCRIFSAVHAATTPAQREQAVRRLRAYQRDLRELAAPA